MEVFVRLYSAHKWTLYFNQKSKPHLVLVLYRFYDGFHHQNLHERSSYSPYQLCQNTSCRRRTVMKPCHLYLVSLVFSFLLDDHLKYHLYHFCCRYLYQIRKLFLLVCLSVALAKSSKLVQAVTIFVKSIQGNSHSILHYLVICL